MFVSDQTTSTADAAEMAAAAKLTTKVLAIGTWTAKATPETRPPIMPSEARETMRLMLAGKIDQWFAKNDGSGAVFLMNVADPAEAHALLENLPLGRADMMRFELIPVGPLWPLGLLHGRACKNRRSPVATARWHDGRERKPRILLEAMRFRSLSCGMASADTPNARMNALRIRSRSPNPACCATSLTVVPPFLHHESRGLQSKLFDGFCR